MTDLQTFGLIGGGILFLVCIFLVYAARKKSLLTRRVGEMDFTPIGKLGKGMVKVRGRVSAKGGEDLRSPMGEKACVYYSFELEEQRTRTNSKGHSSTYWSTVVNDERSVPCSVRDESGSCEIDLHSATIDLVEDSRLRSGFLNDAPAHIEQMLQERYGRSSVGFVFNKGMRYTETALEINDEVRVLGEVRRHGGGNPHIVEGEAPLLVSDKGESALSNYFRRQVVNRLLFAALCFVVSAVILYLTSASILKW